MVHWHGMQKNICGVEAAQAGDHWLNSGKYLAMGQHDPFRHPRRTSCEADEREVFAPQFVINMATIAGVELGKADISAWAFVLTDVDQSLHTVYNFSAILCLPQTGLVHADPDAIEIL
jgi:hypothetical protein